MCAASLAYKYIVARQIKKKENMAALKQKRVRYTLEVTAQKSFILSED